MKDQPWLLSSMKDMMRMPFFQVRNQLKATGEAHFDVTPGGSFWCTGGGGGVGTTGGGGNMGFCRFSKSHLVLHGGGCGGLCGEAGRFCDFG